MTRGRHWTQHIVAPLSLPAVPHIVYKYYAYVEPVAVRYVKFLQVKWLDEYVGSGDAE